MTNRILKSDDQAIVAKAVATSILAEKQGAAAVDVLIAAVPCLSARIEEATALDTRSMVVVSSLRFVM